MGRRHVELTRIDCEGELPADPGPLDLHKRNRARFPRRADERDRHLIRRIEGFDQDLFVAFESGGIIDQKGGELIETGVLHRALSFHRDPGMQTVFATCARS